MQKNHVRFFTGIFVVLVAVGLVTVGGLKFPNANAAIQAADYYSGYHSAQGVYENINGNSFTNQEFQLFSGNEKLMASLKGETLPSSSIINNDFKRMAIIYSEATKEGLAVSQSQAMQYASTIRNAIESQNLSSSGQQVLSAIQEEEQALGITDNQYWNTIAPMLYQRELSIGNLRSKVISSYKALHQSADSAQLETFWKAYVQQLQANAKITN